MLKNVVEEGGDMVEITTNLLVEINQLKLEVTQLTLDGIEKCERCRAEILRQLETPCAKKKTIR